MPDYNLLREWYQQYRFALWHYIKKRIKNYDDAQDLLSEVFKRMITHADSLKDIKKVKSWLWQIAHHLIVDYYHRQHYQRNQVVSLSEDNENNLIAKSENLLLNSAVQKTLNKLPKAQAQLLILRHFENRDIAEIAQITNKTQSATYKALRRAEAHFKKIYHP